ncbi:single-stranded DNA-binding protein [Saccharopolyspora sp. NPDC000359]|uniref:single-stranded DNA-binding protein n=1 Tax=Saccharopolyspora sp. NPDC000359 TaxID=3154251 RepID=UPI00332396B3
MALPDLHGVGRLTDDPELRFAPSGAAVCTMTLAFNARRKDQTGEWVDGDSFFIRATAFRDMAEHIAESLTKGAEVIVTGRLKTDQWEDKNSGQKRSAPSLLIDSIGPNLRGATANVTKANRATAGQPGDPWGAVPQRSSNEPPF